MANSRLQFLNDDPRPSNTNKGKGLILETPYHPGFVDDKDLETIKMAVDKELSDISNAFYQTTEKTADTIKRIDKIEIEGDGLLAKIEEVDRVSKEGDKALSERITTVQAESESGLAKVTNQITAVSDKLGTVEAKWGLQVEAGDVVGSIELGATSGGESHFRVRADRFTVSNGGTESIPPFEVVGGHTRINSAYINSIQSDNWGPSSGGEGWAITRDGWAHFNNITAKGTIYADAGYFKGHVEAGSGSFKGHVEASSGTFKGSVQADSGYFNGTVNANAGDFNNVVIRENCTVLGTIHARQVIDGIIDVRALGSDGAFDFGVKDFPRLVSVQMSVGSGYRNDSPSQINAYVNGVHIGGVYAAAVVASPVHISVASFGVAVYSVPAYSGCVVSVGSGIGKGGSTSGLAIVNKAG